MKVNTCWFEPSNRRFVFEFKGSKGETWFRYFDVNMGTEMAKAWINSLINDVENRLK